MKGGVIVFTEKNQPPHVTFANYDPPETMKVTYEDHYEVGVIVADVRSGETAPPVQL